MLGLGMGRTLRRGAVRILGKLEGMLEQPPEPVSRPHYRASGRTEAPPPAADPMTPRKAVAPAPTPTPVAAKETASEVPTAPKAVAKPVVKAVEVTTESNSPFTTDELESFLDLMVRPALNMDGGDVTLIRIDNHDIYVQLIGACSTCPSSTITMKMGIERLLHEEFPTWHGELRQVGGMF